MVNVGNRFCLWKCVVILCLSWSTHSLQAQTNKISGQVLDEEEIPLPNISVSYKKPGAVVVLGFTKTDNSGRFLFEIGINELDSLQFDFNHLGYASKSVTVANQSGDHRFTLRAYTHDIQEVEIKKLPVYRRRDTINFEVSAFTSQEDRVIADIIRKLPGVEINGNQILYQGSPIQKFMVNNLDLMEGRYALINNNLPADAVRSVQIIENDQPIKILDSLLFSERASLNLDLKKFTTTGTGQVGVGIEPLLWSLNLTPITFGKSFQMLNTFQTNNNGHDVAKDLFTFYSGSSFLGSQGGIGNGPSYISIRDVASPGFDEKKWLDNQIFLVSTNTLNKLQDGLEIKGNVSFYNDTRDRKGFTTTKYTFSEDMIINQESVENRYHINVFDAGVLIEKNQKQIYLRNNLKYRGRWNQDHGDLVFNEEEIIHQERRYKDQAFFNHFSMARFIGKQLINFSSTVEYHDTPQRLAVLPGQFQEILQQGDHFDQMLQNVNYRGGRWNNRIGLTTKKGRWTFSPVVGMNYIYNHLETEISTTHDEENEVLGEGFYNNVVSSHINFDLGLRMEWSDTKWKMNADIPFKLYRYQLSQENLRALTNVFKYTVNPSVRLNYLINNNNTLSINGFAGNSYGGLDNFYSAYIINDYRNIQRYETRLLGSNIQSYSLNYEYKNLMKAHFAHINYRVSQGSRDYILNRSIDLRGSNTVNIVDQISTNIDHTISGGVSKFFLSSKTTAKINGQASWSGRDYLINETMSRQYTRSTSGTFEVTNNIFPLISIDYKYTAGQYLTQMAIGQREEILYHNHYLNIAFSSNSPHSFLVYNSYYLNNIPGRADQYFLDLSYRFRIARLNTDILLTASNIFNKAQYIQQFSSNIELVQSHFNLRPRTFMVSTSFRF